MRNNGHPKRMTSSVRGPVDLLESYCSAVDGTDQPYRLYLPSAYDGSQPVPLLIALHGQGRDHNAYFDSSTYGDGIYKREVERQGMAMACPYGRGDWQYRGLGENDVLAVLEDVCRRYNIDRDRVVLTGQSMGGTGTTYLCCRYPDLFAAGIPLASTYGHLSLAANLRHIPMLFVQGADDWPIYAKDGPIPLTEELQRLGYDARLWMIPNAGHHTMEHSTRHVVDWASRQRRVTHPSRVTIHAYLPIHGRAYWVEIRHIEKVGLLGKIDARTEQGNRIDVEVENVRQMVLRPDPEQIDPERPVSITINGDERIRTRWSQNREICLDHSNGHWSSRITDRVSRDLDEYPRYRIGRVGQPPTWDDVPESTMGNWTADAMRDITGTDIAICNRWMPQGVQLQPGRDLYLTDLLDWRNRPAERTLAILELDGDVLLEIIEDNIRDEAEYDYLIQVSGCRYSFDRSRPKGRRIVSTDIQPGRKYSVCCESYALTRTDTMYLAGRHGKLPYISHEANGISAAWRYIERHGRLLHADPPEGRIVEL